MFWRTQALKGMNSKAYSRSFTTHANSLFVCFFVHLYQSLRMAVECAQLDHIGKNEFLPQNSWYGPHTHVSLICWFSRFVSFCLCSYVLVWPVGRFVKSSQNKMTSCCFLILTFWWFCCFLWRFCHDCRLSFHNLSHYSGSAWRYRYNDWSIRLVFLCLFPPPLSSSFFFLYLFFMFLLSSSFSFSFSFSFSLSLPSSFPYSQASSSSFCLLVVLVLLLLVVILMTLLLLLLCRMVCGRLLGCWAAGVGGASDALGLTRKHVSTRMNILFLCFCLLLPSFLSFFLPSSSSLEFTLADNEACKHAHEFPLAFDSSSFFSFPFFFLFLFLFLLFLLLLLLLLDAPELTQQQVSNKNASLCCPFALFLPFFQALIGSLLSHSPWTQLRPRGFVMLITAW